MLSFYCCTLQISMGEISLLLVEDNFLNQKLICFNLEKFGFKIDIAENGLEAIKFVEAKRYDLILMDLMMPIMDGLEATVRIRKLEENNCNHTIIIGLTANVYDTDREKCLAHGMDEFLAKPFDIVQFKNILEDFGLNISSVGAE